MSICAIIPLRLLTFVLFLLVTHPLPALALSCGSYSAEEKKFYAENPEPVDPRVVHPTLEGRIADAPYIARVVVKGVTSTSNSQQYQLGVLDTYKQPRAGQLVDTRDEVRLSPCGGGGFALKVGQIWLFDGSFKGTQSFIIEDANSPNIGLTSEQLKLLEKLESQTPLVKTAITQAKINAYLYESLVWKKRVKAYNPPCALRVPHAPRRPVFEIPSLEGRYANTEAVYVAKRGSDGHFEVMKTYKGNHQPGSIISDYFRPGSLEGQTWIIAPELHHNDSFLIKTSDGKVPALSTEMSDLLAKFEHGTALQRPPLKEPYLTRFREAEDKYELQLADFKDLQKFQRWQLMTGSRMCKSLSSGFFD